MSQVWPLVPKKFNKKVKVKSRKGLLISIAIAGRQGTSVLNSVFKDTNMNPQIYNGREPEICIAKLWSG